MTNDPNASRGRDPDEATDARDAELKQVLRAALTPPFDDVDWERLHAGIMASAATQLGGSRGAAVDWMATWSRGGIPAAGAALAAAVVAMLVLPTGRRAIEPAPPGFLPVAEELMSNLPADTRRLLSAGYDVESLLGALLEDGRRERDVT